ncbi:MAG: hypothetical protein JW866_10490 [Ignavibacteriales bacterium]|nr:hypothetical protein [Ignavibacteriales bacterium]
MKNFILLFGTLIITTCAFAQDIIYKVDGSEIKTKVIEITTNEIKYKNFEQLESALLNIPISQVFMIIYESGEKEVFKNTQQQQLQQQSDNNVQSNMALSGISKENLSIEIIDNRADKILIGQEPSRGAAAVGLIVQPNASVNDNEGKIYSYAVKTLENVLGKNDFKNNNNPNCKLEIKILELFHEAKAGLYGAGGHVTQNCKASISIINNNNVVFTKDFSSLYSSKAKEFISQSNLLKEQYSETLDKKAKNKKLREEMKEYSVKGHFINFIIVFDDIVHQLLNDKDFQNSLSI